MKRKLLWNTQTPLPVMSSSLCSLPSQLCSLWCRICAMLTAISIQPRGHSLEGQLTQDILLHISNLLPLPLCVLQALSGALPFALEAKAVCNEP